MILIGLRNLADALSFVAMGFEKSNEETGMDVVKIELNGPYCSVFDAWMLDGVIQMDYVLGGTDDLFDSSCSVQNGFVEATFKRTVSIEDITDLPITENGYTDVVFLWNEDGTNVSSESSK